MGGRHPGPPISVSTSRRAFEKALPEGFDGYGGWPRGSSPPPPLAPSHRTECTEEKAQRMDGSFFAGQRPGCKCPLFFWLLQSASRDETRRASESVVCAYLLPRQPATGKPRLVCPTARGGGSLLSLLVHSLLPTFVGWAGKCWHGHDPGYTQAFIFFFRKQPRPERAQDRVGAAASARHC